MDHSDFIHDWAEKWAGYRPEATAFKEYESGRQVNFAQLNQLGEKCAQFLLSNQVQKGDRVAVLAENCLEYILLFVAAQKTGIILVPLNYRLSAPEIAYLLQDASPSLVIVEEQFQGKYEASAWSKAPTISLEKFKEAVQLENLGESDASAAFDPPTAKDPIFILYTSGSTGFPKGAIYTHEMLFWNSINTGFSVVVNSQSRTLTCMPPFHTGGWNVLLTPFFHHGGYTCLMKKFDAEAVVQALDTERATIFMGVPTMLRMMADSPAFQKAHFNSLLYFLVGGEAMPLSLIKLWNDKGVPIRQGYGMTECGPNLTSLHQDDALSRAGSIGKANFFIKTRVVNEKGEDCPQGTKGELLIAGPVVTPGYWNNEEASQKSIKNGWFHTGDVVREETGGYLYVVDRIKNMFISGGENVYPSEVERVLLACDQIAEAVVVAVPDEKWGEVGKAFLVTRGKLALDVKALREHCGQNLARFKIPKFFQQLDELPKGDTGKINRKELQAS